MYTCSEIRSSINKGYTIGRLIVHDLVIDSVEYKSKRLPLKDVYGVFLHPLPFPPDTSIIKRKCPKNTKEKYFLTEFQISPLK